MSTESPFATPSPAPPVVTQSNTTTILLVVLGGLFLMSLMCGGMLIALLLPAVSSARHAARTMQVSNQMKQIGLGFHNYHSAYNQLPPALTTNSGGQPLHSWRVTLLPFLEEIILMADGSVHILNKPIEPQMVEAMVTRSGGESISF